MVKRCSHGLCNSDDRYPDRLDGGRIKFVPFLKPKTNLEKCLRWIRLCGRPHEQLNTSKINANKYVCTKHFVDMSGPTEEFPDPLPADSVIPTPKCARKPSTKRRKLDLENEGELDKEDLSVQSTSSQSNDNGDTATEEESKVNSTASPTSSKWMDQLLDCLACENEKLKKELAEASLHSVHIKRQLAESEDQCKILERKTTVTFTVEEIIKDEKLIQYYTGFSKESFLAIFKFLVPEESQRPLDFVGKGNLSQIQMLSLKNQLFLTLCKLRNDFDFQDLAHRFAITPQVASFCFCFWFMGKLYVSEIWGGEYLAS